MGNLTIIVAVVSLMFSVSTIAQTMSKQDYEAGLEQAESEYKSNKENCKSLTGNVADICIAEAKGKEKVAKANLEANYKNTKKAHYNAEVAKAEADYLVAKERCDDLAGNDKDVCVKEAKAAKTAAKADAKARMKTSKAFDKAKEESNEARTEAKEKSTDAQRDATVDKRDAEYAVAKQKCDTLSGTAKDDCINKAKADYGKM